MDRMPPHRKPPFFVYTFCRRYSRVTRGLPQPSNNKMQRRSPFLTDFQKKHPQLLLGGPYSVVERRGYRDKAQLNISHQRGAAQPWGTFAGERSPAFQTSGTLNIRP
jgi:hypothetical protein